MVGETVRFRATKQNLLPNAPNDAARIGIVDDDGEEVQLRLGIVLRSIKVQGEPFCSIQPWHPARTPSPRAPRPSDLPAHLYWQVIDNMMVACAKGGTALVKPKG